MLAENISIILNLTSWLGILPFYKREKKKFCTLLFLPVIFATWCTLTNIRQIYWNYKHFDEIDILDVWVQPLINWVFYIQTITTVNIKLPKVQRLFDTLNEIDANLQENLKVESPKLKYVTVGLLLVHFMVMFMNAADLYFYADSGNWLHHFCFYSSDPWSVYNIQIAEYTKYLIIKAIQLRFRVCNNQLQKETIISSVKTVDYYISVHASCCDLVEIFNDIYGFNMLISMIQTLGYSLRLCFLLVHQANDEVFIGFVLMWTINSGVSIFLIRSQKLFIYFYLFFSFYLQ